MSDIRSRGNIEPMPNPYGSDVARRDLPAVQDDAERTSPGGARFPLAAKVGIVVEFSDGRRWTLATEEVRGFELELEMRRPDLGFDWLDPYSLGMPDEYEVRMSMRPGTFRITDTAWQKGRS